MRFDDAPPRTWLFAVLAGWALLAWLLAMAGLGRRIVPLDADPSLVQALPKPQAAVRSRLGPAQQYAAIAERPLFSSDRKPKPFVLKADNEGEQAKPFDYVLTSVLLGPRTRIAIVQPTGGGDSVSFKLNESAATIPSWRLVAVEPRSATFTGPEGERTLELRRFDGNGGQPATASAAQGARPGQPGVIARPAAPPAAAQNAARNANAGRQPSQVGAPPQEVADVPPPMDPNSRPQQQQESQNPQSAEAEAQIEAIRRRIQARREQLRREADQAPPSDNP